MTKALVEELRAKAKNLDARYPEQSAYWRAAVDAPRLNVNSDVNKQRGRPTGVKDAAPRIRATQPSGSRSKTVRAVFDKLRVRRLTTMSALSDRTGYSRQSLSFYKSGRQMPNAEALDEIVDALGYDIVLVRKGASAEQLMADLGIQVSVKLRASTPVSSVSSADDGQTTDCRAE